jgi:hypothetical protein
LIRSHNWGFDSRRPRSRLRKRNTIRGFRKYYNFATGNNDAIYDKERVLESGYTVGQGWGCLDKAWNGFMRAKRLENHKDMTLYASIIQRVEKELKLEINDFPELGLCACELRADAKEEEGEDDYVKIDCDSL